MPPLRGVRLGGTTLELAESATYGKYRRIKMKHKEKKGIGNIRFSNTSFVLCYAVLYEFAARCAARIVLLGSFFGLYHQFVDQI